jgi:hypothetical protein
MAPSPSPRGRQVTVVQALALLLAFVLTAGVGGLLTAGLVLPTVAVANTATDLSVEAFEDLPSELETRPLSEKSVMLANDGTLCVDRTFLLISWDPSCVNAGNMPFPLVVRSLDRGTHLLEFAGSILWEKERHQR